MASVQSILSVKVSRLSEELTRLEERIKEIKENLELKEHPYTTNLDVREVNRLIPEVNLLNTLILDKFKVQKIQKAKLLQSKRL